MTSRFFIESPIVAWVVAIVVMLAGGLSLSFLPIAQYPSIAPPTITVTATYPGASAITAQNTVGQVIEQQLSGLDHLLYFSSQSAKDGTVQITLSFAQGTDPDIAQVQVQNKLQLATPRLPEAVQLEGITVAKATKSFLLIVGFVSTDGSLNSFQLSNFISSTIEDPVSRTKGVGGYELFGSESAMRIWLDPSKLFKYKLTPNDVSSAIATQNVQISAGELGALPSVAGQQLNATIVGPSYLETPEEFGHILLKVLANGARVQLKDVARIEIAAEQYSPTAEYNGKPASAIAVNLAAGANALATVAAVKRTIASLQGTFPAGVEAIYPYDTSPFVRLSIREVIKTLAIAIVLVFLIMYLFLQNLRATLIPTIAVPVVLLGTCGVLAMAGYSINCLTLFGMVLAIGLLVDDAIVVVENVERVMAEDGVSPREAALRSMRQISGALVGIALVLTAVLLPMAFFCGSTGVIYRQFSVTIVSAMILSMLLALIFTPALCATLLKPRKGGRTRRGPFGLFNRGFDAAQRGYSHRLGAFVRRRALVMITLGLITGAMVTLYGRVPLGFLPNEDQGVLYAQVSEPPGATHIRTQAVLDRIRDYFLTKEQRNVAGIFTVNGLSFSGSGQNAGLCFIRLKPWDQRPGAINGVEAVGARAQVFFSTITDALVFAFVPPPILDLGNASGFDLELMDNAGLGHAALQAASDRLLVMAAQDKLIGGARANSPADEPQYRIIIDREKALALGLSLADINATISTAWGSGYIDDFINKGRVKRVFVEGDAPSRMLPSQLMTWYARSSQNDMVPFSAFAHGVWTSGPPQLNHYDGVPSVEIVGVPAPGVSAGQGMAEIQRLAGLLPAGIGYEWTGLSYEEQAAGSQAIYAYGIALVLTFLCLTALYQSWSVPVAVLFVVPLGIIGAVMATYFRGLANDIYFQVGLLVTIGLSTKNAVLIVEFAKQGYDEGAGVVEAAVTAAHERLRPILMTSFAFVLGVLPLALSTGAGSGSENAIGTVVVGGMLSATLLAIFMVPVFFVLVVKLFRVQPKPRRPLPPMASASESAT